MEKTIEIPFGAKDSELKGWEHTIPENMEAEIKDGKIIVKPKESEDERIRKQLIGFLSGSYALCNINTKDAIAYLERQKPAEWSDSAAKEMFIKALERAVEQTKKGYELTDCDKHSWWEDFKAYSGIKPAEWSEDDETCLEYALWCVMKTRHFVAKDACDLDACRSAERWLKSLRPQPHWKPSDEQMWALDVALENFYHKDDRAALESLRTDLKNYFSHEIH